MQATARSLSGRRGSNLLFSQVAFSLSSGQGLTVTGPNGVGKSTLLRILAGLLPADGGTFEVTEKAGAHLPIAEAVHYLGHRNAMKRELTVVENLAFWQRFQRGDASAGLAVEAAIARVELEGIGHLPFGYLSAGQQRRIALARLLLVERPLWILDEPTAALDKRSDRLFGEIASGHLAGGGMLIVATHLPLDIAGMCSLELQPAQPERPMEGWL